MLTPTVLLMLKAPIEGAVKTRLGSEIGAAVATSAYRRLVEHQLRQVPAGWHIHVCYAPVGAEGIFREWLGEDLRYTAQAEGDLGARLSRSADEHFRQSASPLIILGGDCPYLTTEPLQDAAAALTGTDAVLVPALDGGYCLIGLRVWEGNLFRAITWGTGMVLAETRERLRERGLPWVELAALEDVDDAASWARATMAFPHLSQSAL
jgi:rSAM/selenodomain-associated transferase 1